MAKGHKHSQYLTNKHVIVVTWIVLLGVGLAAGVVLWKINRIERDCIQRTCKHELDFNGVSYERWRQSGEISLVALRFSCSKCSHTQEHKTLPYGHDAFKYYTTRDCKLVDNLTEAERAAIERVFGK